MDAKLKAKWVKALRSGKYKQGIGKLKNRDRYCCLGVLCKIQRVNLRKTYPAGYAVSSLPARYAGGLSSEQAADLANRNDGTGKHAHNPQTFKQIADYIEEHL